MPDEVIGMLSRVGHYVVRHLTVGTISALVLNIAEEADRPVE